jgi:glycosyltransferase involved in cell wall biosynthesis
VVIPAYNEESTVGRVVAGVVAEGLDVVVIDDGSRDDTGRIAREAGAPVVRMPINVGVGGALRCGFGYAVRRGYRSVVQVDADLQHDPAAVPALIAAAADSGAELVIGSRFAAGYRAPALRRLVMRMLARLVSRRVGVRLDDVTSGFRVITEPLLSAFAAEYPTEYLGDTVEAILAAHGRGARIAQVPVPMSPRAAGSPTPQLHAAGHLARLLLAMALRPRNPRSTAS